MGKFFFTAVLYAVTCCTTATAAAKRPVDAWSYYHFDGRAFVAGQRLDGGRSVVLRERVAPVMATRASRLEAIALSPGKGAVAGICYIQNSGGKLAPAGGYTPVTRSQVQIYSGGRMIAATETDEQGYFVILLDAGRYTVGSGSMRSEVVVEDGKTILVPLRTGKRMVD